jgi:hypothetical protein
MPGIEPEFLCRSASAIAEVSQQPENRDGHSRIPGSVAQILFRSGDAACRTGGLSLHLFRRDA